MTVLDEFVLVKKSAELRGVCLNTIRSVQASEEDGKVVIGARG